MESRTMDSDRTVRCSRAHGGRSPGPVAEEGKPLCPQNAWRHGLLAEQVALDNESREAIDDRPAIAANSGNAKRTQSHFRTPYRRRSCRRCSSPQALPPPPAAIAPCETNPTPFPNTVPPPVLPAVFLSPSTRTPPRRYRAVRNEPNPIPGHGTAAGLTDGVLAPKCPHATPPLSRRAKRTQSHSRTPHRRQSCRRCSCAQAPHATPPIALYETNPIPFPNTPAPAPDPWPPAPDPQSAIIQPKGWSF